jgi:hypothetical protein
MFSLPLALAPAPSPAARERVGVRAVARSFDRELKNITPLKIQSRSLLVLEGLSVAPPSPSALSRAAGEGTKRA